LLGGGTALLSDGCAVVDGCGATEVDGAGPVGEPSGQASTAIGTITAAAAAAMSAIRAALVLCHGSGADRNVIVLLSVGRS
jgi:hypothetical protein